MSTYSLRDIANSAGKRSAESPNVGVVPSNPETLRRIANSAGERSAESQKTERTPWKPPVLSGMDNESQKIITRMMELGNVPNIVIGLTEDYSTDLNKWFDGILSGKYDVNANWTGYEALANPNNLPTCPKMKRDDFHSPKDIY